MLIRFSTLIILFSLLFSCKPDVGLEIGNTAPDLQYGSPSGEIIGLSSLRGKVVLIDFWASWCPPCRRENPNLVLAYKEFKNSKFKAGKGFTIYSISLDKKADEWVAAIKNDQLEWDYHVSDLKGWDCEAANKYNIESIPSNLLIDKNGVILAKDLRGEDLHTFLKNLQINVN